MDGFMDEEAIKIGGSNTIYIQNMMLINISNNQILKNYQ